MEEFAECFKKTIYKEKDKLQRFLHPKPTAIFLLVISTIILLIYSLGRTDALAPIKLSLYCSMSINFVSIFIKLREGIIYDSIWFISFAIYYIFLTGTKFFLLMKVNKANNLEYEYRVYKSVGCFLMLLNLILAGMIVQMVIKNVAVRYYPLLK